MLRRHVLCSNKRFEGRANRNISTDCIYASTRLDMIKRNDTLVVVAERLMCDVAGFAGCGSARSGANLQIPSFFYFREARIKSGRIVGGAGGLAQVAGRGR